MANLEHYEKELFFLLLLFPFFNQHLLPSLAPSGPLLPQMLALAWGRGFRYLTPLESVVWQVRIEIHSRSQACTGGCVKTPGYLLTPTKTRPAGYKNNTLLFLLLPALLHAQLPSALWTLK